MPDKIWKKYQSYFEREGKEVQGIVITARNKRDAAEQADKTYGDDSSVKEIKVKKKILGLI